MLLVLLLVSSFLLVKYRMKKKKPKTNGMVLGLELKQL